MSENRMYYNLVRVGPIARRAIEKVAWCMTWRYSLEYMRFSDTLHTPECIHTLSWHSTHTADGGLPARYRKSRSCLWRGIIKGTSCRGSIRQRRAYFDGDFFGFYFSNIFLSQSGNVFFFWANWVTALLLRFSCASGVGRRGGYFHDEFLFSFYIWFLISRGLFVWSQLSNGVISEIFVSGCAICQNYMFSGESNTLPFFRRLKQIWKTEKLKASQKHGPCASCEGSLLRRGGYFVR